MVKFEHHEFNWATIISFSIDIISSLIFCSATVFIIFFTIVALLIVLLLSIAIRWQEHTAIKYRLAQFIFLQLFLQLKILEIWKKVKEE